MGTGVKGPARLMLTSDDLPKLETYVNIIRPVLDPDYQLDQLLIMYGPRPLTNVHAHIKGLGRKFGFHTPSSTKMCIWYLTDIEEYTYFGFSAFVFFGGCSW